MMDKLDFSGIEVSAEELVVALQREGKRKDLKTFLNSAAGHQALIRHLSCPGRMVRAVLESTGLYGLDLALALQRAGLEVMVANPARGAPLCPSVDATQQERSARRWGVAGVCGSHAFPTLAGANPSGLPVARPGPAVG
jgi:hypothetical protein